MRQISLKKIAFIFTMFVGVFSFGSAEASNVYGSAWSEGVGWISLNSCVSPSNCPSSSGVPSHGVTLDINNNKVSGTAWNANIGLISFNSTDWGKCPPDKVSCNLNNFQNKWDDGGWARAISAVYGSSDNPNNGGWDGWISLGNGSVYNAEIDKNSPVQMASSDFSGTNTYTIKSSANGYWWGDEVVGWINLNPTSSPYDVSKGGIFVTDLEPSLILSGPSFVIAGNDADFTWEATNGFKPTSCERTSGSSGSNWDATSYSITPPNTTEDDIVDIEIPHDNNAESTQTAFTLECTDGIVTHTAVWNVIALQFKPEISFPYSCTAKDSTPVLEILNLDNADSPSCNVYASDSSDPNRLVGSTSLSSISDAGFNDLDTDYTLECINGSSNIAYYESPSATEVELCTPFFEIYGDTRCGTTLTNEKYGDVFAFNGVDYVADVVITLNPFFGFDTTPVSISSPDSNLSFSTNNFTWNGSGYNTITGTYTITDANYITATNDGFDPIVVPLNFSTDPRTARSLNFCPVGSSFVKYKPVYKPF